MIPNWLPSFMGLALHVGLRGLSLGMEGVELLLEPVLGRNARVDRAAQHLGGDRLYEAAPAIDDDQRSTESPGRLIGIGIPALGLPPRSPLPRSPAPKKNLLPFHFTPVIAKATADTLA